MAAIVRHHWRYHMDWRERVAAALAGLSAADAARVVGEVERLAAEARARSATADGGDHRLDSLDDALPVLNGHGLQRGKGSEVKRRQAVGGDQLVHRDA